MQEIFGVYDHLASTTPHHAQRLYQPVGTAIAVAIEYAQELSIRQAYAGIARLGQVAVLDLQQPIRRQQRRMLADYPPGISVRTVEDYHQLHQQAMECSPSAHALK
ncbi:hypothetical protein CW310_10370 [Pseudomonas citronellolis]|nr:hypothetical protein CW310_10370 [Pseudomonas citronellolis]